MIRYLFAAGLGLAVLVCTPEARADDADKKPVATKETATAAKTHKVYNPAVKFDQFTKDLTLTKEQQKEIKPILDDLEKQLLPLKKLTYQRQGQRGAPIVAEYYQKIRELLEPEQLEKFNTKVSTGEITPFMR